MKTPILETQRLILRPLTLEDAPAIQKRFPKWDIIKHLGDAVPWPYPDDGAEDFIKNCVLPLSEKEERHFWGLVPKDGSSNDEAIGVIEFRPEKHKDGHRGFWLCTDYHRQGLMTEAVEAVHDFIFLELKQPEIIVCNNINNEGSRRVKQKTGAEFIGYIDMMHNNGTAKTEQWRITRENWIAFREKNNIQN